jgi:hypothetical protein
VSDATIVASEAAFCASGREAIRIIKLKCAAKRKKSHTHVLGSRRLSVDMLSFPDWYLNNAAWQAGNIQVYCLKVQDVVSPLWNDRKTNTANLKDSRPTAARVSRGKPSAKTAQNDETSLSTRLLIA